MDFGLSIGAGLSIGSGLPIGSGLLEGSWLLIGFGVSISSVSFEVLRVIYWFSASDRIYILNGFWAFIRG